jgi:hypothetical protein
MVNRLASGTTSLHVGGPGHLRLAAVGTLVAVNGLGLGLSAGILKALKPVASEVVGNWLGSLKVGVLDGSLVGTTIGAEVDVVETAGVVETTECLVTRPEEDSGGGVVENTGVVETTECLTTRPDDDSDGEPDGEGLVQSPEDDSDRREVGVVETAGVVETTECLTTRPKDDSDGGLVETAGVVETTECLANRPEDDSDGESDGEPDSEGLVQSPKDNSQSHKDNSDGETDGDIIPIGGVETEGLINRPEDGSDGEPITIGAGVGLDTEGFTTRLVRSTKGFTNCPENGSDGGSDGGSDSAPITIGAAVGANPTEITSGALVNVVGTKGTGNSLGGGPTTGLPS